MAEVKTKPKIEGKLVYRIISGKDLYPEDEELICDPYCFLVLPDGRKAGSTDIGTNVKSIIWKKNAFEESFSVNLEDVSPITFKVMNSYNNTLIGEASINLSSLPLNTWAIDHPL